MEKLSSLQSSYEYEYETETDSEPGVPKAPAIDGAQPAVSHPVVPKASRPESSSYEYEYETESESDKTDWHTAAQNPVMITRAEASAKFSRCYAQTFRKAVSVGDKQVLLINKRIVKLINLTNDHPSYSCYHGTPNVGSLWQEDRDYRVELRAIIKQWGGLICDEDLDHAIFTIPPTSSSLLHHKVSSEEQLHEAELSKQIIMLKPGETLTLKFPPVQSSEK